MADKMNSGVKSFGRGVVVAADKMKKIRKNLKKLDLPNTVHLKSLNNWNKDDAVTWMNEVAGQTLKLSGVTVLWMAENLTRVINKTLVDNVVLRKIEQLVEDLAKKSENIKDKKTGKKRGETDVTRFVKNNPWIMAYFTYWTVLSAGVVGGAAMFDMNSADDTAGIETKQQQKIELVKDEVNKTKMLDPASTDFLNQCIALENITCIPIIYTETYRAEPVVQRYENVWTHGFGMTWSRDKNGHMKIRDYADTKANRSKGLVPHKPKKSSGMDQDIADSQQFLIDHIYPKIQRFMKRPITENEFYGLCVAGYQLPGHIDEICRNLNNAKTPQQIADAFITPNYEKYGGTPKRRWVCGLLAAGYITMQDILNADVDNFYRANLNTVVRKGHFVTNEKTIKYVLDLPGPGKKSTRSVVGSLQDGRLALGQLTGDVESKVVTQQATEEDNLISESMSLVIKAGDEYRAGNLEKAAALYEQAIKMDADNMEAYSSLALMYKKLGDKNRSIDYYEKCTRIVKEGNARMNANKYLLLDRVVKATSYYNAGAAREEMAKIYSKQGNKDKAVEAYKIALRNYQTALENAEMGEMSNVRKQVYKDAVQRIKEHLNGNRVKNSTLRTMNSGVQQMRQKNARADLLLYGTTHGGNMA